MAASDSHALRVAVERATAAEEKLQVKEMAWQDLQGQLDAQRQLVQRLEVVLPASHLSLVWRRCSPLGSSLYPPARHRDHALQTTLPCSQDNVTMLSRQRYHALQTTLTCPPDNGIMLSRRVRLF